MDIITKSTARAVLAVAVLFLPGALSSREPLFEQAVDSAIDRGVEFLLAEIGARQWPPGPEYPDGYIALQLYALLESDVSCHHPVAREGLRLLEGYPPEKVYSVSLAVMAYGAALGQLDEEAREREAVSAPFFPVPGGPLTRSEVVKRMKSAVGWLISARNVKEGTWTYERPRAASGPARFDHSNTQFAVLALGIAEKHGVEVPKRLWEEIADHFVGAQETDGPEVTARIVFAGERAPEGESGGEGSAAPRTPPAPWSALYRDPAAAVRARGWGYTAGSPGNAATFSMTSAGQSSVLLAYRGLGRGTRRARALERAIRDGYGWLTRFLETEGRARYDPYDLYSLEKVGDIGRVERLGRTPWYEKGCDILLARQLPAGGWGPEGTERGRHDTALALLFLGRATALDGDRRPVIRLTGPAGEERSSFSDRYWVHLPTLGASVPLIRFFRRLRNRPTERLCGLAHELLEVYDEDHVDELVLFLLTLDRSPSKRIRGLAGELLGRATGLSPTDSDHDTYRQWILDWGKVRRAGSSRDPAVIRELRTLLGFSPSVPLKLRVIRALQRIGDRAAIEDLLDAMGSDDAELRATAYGAVTVLSEMRFPFHPDAPEEARRAELEKWREWWRQAGGGE